MSRTAYKYKGQSGGRYHWVAVLPVSPGDSRYEHVSCDVNTFWGRESTIHGTCGNEATNHDPHFYGNRRFFCSGDVGMPEDVEVWFTSRDRSRGALIYPIAGVHPQTWRIRVHRYPEGEAGAWFGGRVLWEHDKARISEARKVAQAWTREGKLPEGVIP